MSISWLLMMGWMIVYRMENTLVCEINHGDFNETSRPFVASILQPPLTRLIIYLKPEAPLSMLMGIGLMGFGFGMLSARSSEQVHSRIFRWTLIAMATAVCGMVSPWLSLRSCLCGGLDKTWLDEVIFPVPGAVLLYVAIRHAKKHP